MPGYFMLQYIILNSDWIRNYLRDFLRVFTITYKFECQQNKAELCIIFHRKRLFCCSNEQKFIDTKINVYTYMMFVCWSLYRRPHAS